MLSRWGLLRDRAAFKAARPARIGQGLASPLALTRFRAAPISAPSTSKLCAGFGLRAFGRLSARASPASERRRYVAPAQFGALPVLSGHTARYPSPSRAVQKGLAPDVGHACKEDFRLGQRPAAEDLPPKVAAINALEPEIAKLSDDELRARTDASGPSSRPARRSTTSWSRPSPPCARRPSARSASAISTCS